MSDPDKGLLAETGAANGNWVSPPYDGGKRCRAEDSRFGLNAFRLREMSMFVVHNRIDIPADAAQAFEEGFARSMQQTLAGVPGLQRSVLLRPAKAGGPYVATMEFASREDFLAWRNSDAFRTAHGGDRAAGEQPPSAVESFTVVEDVRP